MGKRKKELTLPELRWAPCEVFISHLFMRRATTQLSFMLLSALATAVLAHNDSAVCVLTMYDFHSFATWGALVMRRTVLWAAHNSYTLIIKPFCSLQNTWCIPHEAHRVLNERADCRLLLYIDGDAMIARMDWRVPWPANSSSIVITKHASGMLNVGLFAVHNTKRARDALAWWASYGNGTCRRDLPMISWMVFANKARKQLRIGICDHK